VDDVEGNPSLSEAREGEVCMKYKDHHMRHPRGHLAIKQMPKEQEVAHGATINLDAGKTPCWAGAPKKFVGSLPPVTQEA